MFKKYRKLTAVVLSLALVATSLAFVPKSAQAAAAIIDYQDHTIGTNGWTYNFSTNHSSATISGGTAIDDPFVIDDCSKSGWGWDDIWVQTPEYTVPYTDTYDITLTYYDVGGAARTCWSIFVDGNEAYTTWKQDHDAWTPVPAEEDFEYTYTLSLTKGQKLKVKHGQNYSSAGYKDYNISIVGQNPPQPTTTEEPTTADPSIPTNVAAYNYYANDKGYQLKFDPVTGADSYNVYIDDEATPLTSVTSSGTYLSASLFSAYASQSDVTKDQGTDSIHTMYLTSVTGGVESPKSAGVTFRTLSKTTASSDPTDIPRVYIVTNKGATADITKEKKTACSLIVKGGQDGIKNVIGDGTIKLRGNSTKFADKKAYNISFNSKQSVMDGRNKGKKWCLLAGAYEKSLLRTKVGMYLGKIFNNVPSPEDHYVEVYMNGKLMGLYDMCEPADNGRSGIDYDEDNGEVQFEMENNDRDELPIGVMYHTTATTKTQFICEEWEDEVIALVDEWKETHTYNPDTRPQCLAYVADGLANNADPNIANGYNSWVETIENFDKSCRNYASNKFFDLIDEKSFEDMYLINEIMNTVDFSYSSVKFYTKTENGRKVIHAGCIWDFDLSSGNSGDSTPTETQYYTYINARRFNAFRCQFNPWFKYMMRNDKFSTAVKKRFEDNQVAVRNIYTNSTGMGKSYIDQMREYIQPALTRNYNGTAGYTNTKTGVTYTWSPSTADSYEYTYAYSYSTLTSEIENIGTVTKGKSVEGVTQPIKIVDDEHDTTFVSKYGTNYSQFSYDAHVDYLKCFLAEHVQHIYDSGWAQGSNIQESNELDITGYQMSATMDDTVGKIGFRNVYQFEPTIMGSQILERGLVYGLANDGEQDTGITADDVWVGNPSEYVASFEATAAGKIDYQMGDSKTADYYAMTMMNDSTVSAKAYNARYIVRAFAKTSGGGYVYSKPYSYKYFDVADHLYQNNLFSNELTHNSIYDDVLHKIDSSYQPVDYYWGNMVVRPE